MNRRFNLLHGMLVASCALVLCCSSAIAQSVVTNPVTTTTYCSTSSISVSYDATGSFGAKNAFSLQLSGPDGTFGGSFATLGSIRSTTSGTITATIPASVGAGTHYRVRVTSSNPYIAGPDNGADITIGSIPQSNFWASKAIAMIGDSIWFSAATADSSTGLSYSWDFGADATPSTATTPSVSVVYATGGPKSVTLTVTGMYGCSSTTVLRADSNLALGMPRGGVTIIDCNLQIPSKATIDSTEDPSGPGGGGAVVWVVPGATFMVGGGGDVIFAEPGARILTGGAGSCTFYLKDGASLDLGGGGGSHVVVAGAGAGITSQGGAAVYRCSDLSFDYTVAPPYKFPVGAVSTQSSSQLTMYPNPTASMLFVQLKERPSAMKVRDERGSEILSATGDFTNLLQIDVRSLAAGTYYLELQYPNDKSVERFVVAR